MIAGAPSWVGSRPLPRSASRAETRQPSLVANSLVLQIEVRLSLHLLLAQRGAGRSGVVSRLVARPPAEAGHYVTLCCAMDLGMAPLACRPIPHDIRASSPINHSSHLMRLLLLLIITNGQVCSCFTRLLRNHPACYPSEN